MRDSSSEENVLISANFEYSGHKKDKMIITPEIKNHNENNITMTSLYEEERF